MLAQVAHEKTWDVLERCAGERCGVPGVQGGHWPWRVTVLRSDGHRASGSQGSVRSGPSTAEEQEGSLTCP